MKNVGSENFPNNFPKQISPGHDAPARKKPRILIIGSVPPPSIGPSVAMQRLVTAPALHQEFEVDFLDISDRRPPGSIGAFDWMNLALGLKHAIQCLKRLICRRPRALYLGISQGTWGYLRDLTFILPALCLRRRVVLHLRGSEFRSFVDRMPRWLHLLTRYVLARISRMIVLGGGVKGTFAGLVEMDRVTVIPNGIDCDQFSTRRGSPAAGRPKRLLYLSSIKRRKGIFLLLEALPRVLAKHADLEVTIAGVWHCEEERLEAEEVIGRFGLSNNLRFVGEVTGAEKIRVFQDHDMFVFTPVQPEGLPWVILEAMSAGLPVVTTSQGAIAEVVEHSVSGLIVQPKADQVAQSICYFLENPSAAVEIGQRGRKRVEEHFSEKPYILKLVNLFLDVANGPENLQSKPLSQTFEPISR